MMVSSAHAEPSNGVYSSALEVAGSRTAAAKTEESGERVAFRLLQADSCAPGEQWANISGNSAGACEACVPGMFDHDADGATMCRYCRSGSVAAGSGTIECLACPSGTSTAGEDYLLDTGHGCAWCGGAADAPLTDVASGKPATQSSEGWGGRAEYGNNGVGHEGEYGGDSCTHTLADTRPEWWQVDLSDVTSL